MKKVLQILFHPLLLVLYGFLALAALVWWVGPVLSWNDDHPLDGAGARLWTIAGLAVFIGLIVALRAWRRKRNSTAMVRGLQGGPSASDREAEQLDKRFTEALATLEDSARQSGKRSFLNRGGYLYERPWYIFIGAPGSGKTTALLNAGLTFPLAGKMGQGAIKGVGGTRNCDWWFTDEAVLIDTAGRYTLQKSDEKVDATAWENFLGLLKKSRPRRPINGVILTVNVQDLLQQSPADRKDHAARLRTRLQELHQRLGIRPPVYVMVTKTDLIAGFNETFGEFAKEERDQVWGFSFPHDPRGLDNPMQSFPAEFAALEKRLRDRLLDALQAERDVMKRAAVFTFPQQFGGLKGLLGGFLEQVFDGGGSLEERALLRGVYFTSGTQEGSPIDRVLGTLARTFGVDQKAAGIASSRGKSFFLARLLKDVIFVEQGLAGENKQVAASRRRLRLAGFGVLGLTSVALLAGWVVSLWRNQAYVAEVEGKLPELKAAVDTVVPNASSDFGTLPAVLDLLNQAATPAGFDHDNVPLLNGLGLYQGRYLQAGADTGYRHLLDHALLPRVVRRLEERLRAANRDNLELAYEALKAYVMLYTPERFDAESLHAWVTLDWDANLAGTLNDAKRAALGVHLANALAQGAPQAIAPMDKTLVANVREMLVAYPLEYRIFSRLRRAGAGSDFPEISIAAAGGPNSAQVFERASGQPITKGVPGLFTKDGYFKGFTKAVARVTPTLAAEQEWVLGTPASPGGVKDAAKNMLAGNELDAKIRRLYLQEYIKVWDAYLKDVRLVRLDGIDRSVAVARVLAAPDSPLMAWIRAVTRETQLGAAVKARDEARADSVAGGLLSKAGKAKEDMAALVGKAPDPAAKADGDPLEQMVDDHFAHIHRLLQGQPAPIEEVGKLFNEVYVQLNAVSAAQKSKSAPPAGGGGGGSDAAKAAAGLQPEPIKSILEALGSAGAAQSRNAERQGLSAELKPIAEQCQRTIAGRFPFAPGSKSDVLPDDFGQMFGVGGQLDDFYNRRLATLVDTGVTPWTFKPLTDGTRPPGGAALADFQRAAKIREAFFRSGGKQPGFKVDVRVVEMAEGLKEVDIDIDGQVLKFAPGNTAAQTITWPSTKVASQIKLSGGPGTTPQLFEGPWALFRLFNSFEIQPSPQPEKFAVVMTVDGKKLRMEVISGSALNPLRLREMSGFRCPDAL
ncbi:type VI secretion system membrane subunit TssM [Ideonella sp. 4Y16]|uniref:Type VI secretion system membrane subunit TssM n=1 Tax=Ideonella alba TaxID=2824118 RepID=A0A940YDH3_9BURK|nr:type VI secretion system membrane subunit TssM [Ideonella alba]MBQ0930395.1 type VI secretion system membrane subunit TssM [Ideonella alba]MBQ0946250.1 type VI secretion system membrane subunit TssM [Ideonella alba]